MSTLAILGGDPVIKVKLPSVDDASGRFIADEELELVTEVIKSGHLNYINGPKIAQFEKDFAKRYNVKYAATCSSGTASLHGAVLSLDLEPGDEVIVAPITDMGTIIPILMQNLVPVFADVDPDTHNIDPKSIAEKVTSKTRAIIVVHMFGHSVDMDPVMETALKHNLYVIEDCCQAFLTEYKGRLCGTIGDIGCFSFQQSKQMTTGDGGMIITNNDKLGKRAKLCVDKGWPRGGEFRDHLFLAPAYHMTEMQAAVGIAQLKKLDKMIECRQNSGERLTELLSGCEGLIPPQVRSYSNHTYWKYSLKLDMGKLSADLDTISKALNAEGLLCWAGYTKVPIYMYNVLTIPSTYGRSGYPLTGTGRKYEQGLCPNAEKDLKEMLVVPISEKYTEEHIALIAEALRKVISYYTIVESEEDITE